jgi:hypothetical protein
MTSTTFTRGSANGNPPPGAPDGRVASRLAPLARRRRPAVWALGLALVCAGAALAAVLTAAAGDRVEVLAVVRPVAVGEAISHGDLGVARVAADPQLDPIPAAQRDSVVGQFADVELRPGTLLTRGQLTSVAIPGPGQAVVGVPLRPGQLPARSLRPGDRVLAVERIDLESPTVGGGADASRPARGAVVVGTGPAGPEGVVVVDLVVSERDGVALAAAAADGRLSLVLLPRGG